jgi:acetylornithine deacetylase/succinyl-diaminopimelate desuccinylase-like protein
MLAENEQSDLIALTRQLIRTPSLSGQEAPVAAVVTAAMRGMGYHDVHTDDWGNVVGIIRGSGISSVLFDAHMDTVPWTAGAWQREPLGGEIAAGRLWGRGTADMKGALAAAIYGIGRLARDPGDMGTVYVSCSVCEEPAEGPMLMEVCRRWQPDAVVIQEATALNVNIGQRGRAELIVESVGRPAHSARPDLGINAVKRMATLIAAIEGLSLPVDPRPGDPRGDRHQVQPVPGTLGCARPLPGHLRPTPAGCRYTRRRSLATQRPG